MADARPTVPGRVFCDTLAVEALSRRTQLWTTWDVISETVTLLRYRHSAAAATRFLDGVKPGLHVADYGAEARVEAEQVFRRHGREHRLSLCDAISFVVVTTLLDRMPCFAFDEDFRRLGLTVVTAPQ
jgi:predicted nucleic acid-binding protein